MEYLCKCGCKEPLKNPSRATIWRIKYGVGNAGYIKGHAFRADRNPRWNGGKSLNDNGYILVKPPESYNGPTLKSGYILEHRLVASRMLGRPLNKAEIVHHKNEIKTDNRSENLEITTKELHTRHHSAGGKNGMWADMPEKNCRHCGKKFFPSLRCNYKRNKFCSKVCGLLANSPKGENHFAAKLSRDSVLEIRAQAKKGVTHQKIADSVGVNRGTVSKIIRGERWAHIR